MFVSSYYSFNVFTIDIHIENIALTSVTYNISNEKHRYFNIDAVIFDYISA